MKLICKYCHEEITTQVSFKKDGETKQEILCMTCLAKFSIGATGDNAITTVFSSEDFWRGFGKGREMQYSKELFKKMTKKEKLAFMRIFGTDFMRRMMDKNDH